MNRGIRKFNALNLFGEVEEAEDDDERQQGRDPELIRKRNVRLVHRRYWYQRENPKWSFPAIKEELVNEFEISVTTVDKVLAERESELLLRELMSRRPDNRELKRLYKWMEWDMGKLG